MDIGDHAPDVSMGVRLFGEFLGMDILFDGPVPELAVAFVDRVDAPLFGQGQMGVSQYELSERRVQSKSVHLLPYTVYYLRRRSVAAVSRRDQLFLKYVLFLYSTVSWAFPSENRPDCTDRYVRVDVA